jgi:hypothetical protein
MKILAPVLIALPLVGLCAPAIADEGRMSQTEYVRVGQCLAYTNLRMFEGQALDVRQLTDRFNAETQVKPDETQKRAAAAMRRVYVNAAQADTPGEVEKMRARRDRVCASLVTFAPVQTATR